MLPGMVVITLHFLALALTADLMVTEKEEGTLQRDWTAGVSAPFALLIQICVQLIVVLIQVSLSVGMLIYLYNPPASVVGAVAFLLMLQCCCGMVWGSVLSLSCKTRDQVIQLSVGIIFPAFLLSGVLWPRIGMPTFLKYLSEGLPLTPTCDSVRDLLLKGQVGPGILARSMLLPAGWLVCLLLLAKWKLLEKLHSQ